MPEHIVQRGENVMSLALRFGFASIDPIWNHGKNAELAKSREPGALEPGDVVFIPEIQKKSVSLPTGQLHRIVVKTPKAFLRLAIQTVVDGPMKNMPYRLEAGAWTKEGTTDGQGELEERVPANASEILLHIDGRKLHLHPGTLSSLKTPAPHPVAALQGRLHNLGFFPGELTGTMEPRTEEALRAFQYEYALEETGILDGPTLGKIKEEYGR